MNSAERFLDAAMLTPGPGVAVTVQTTSIAPTPVSPASEPIVEERPPGPLAQAQEALVHALSPLFEYGINHNWCALNPVRKVNIPSDADAQRIHVLTPGEEMTYFDACRRLRDQQLAQSAVTAKETRKWAHQRSAQAYKGSA